MHRVQPTDDQKLKNGFAELRNQFPSLSLQEFDTVSTLVSDLCGEHERLSFHEGLR